MKYDHTKYESEGVFQLRKPDKYEFTVTKAEKQISQAEHDMLHLELMDSDNYSKYPIHHYISEGSDSFIQSMGKFIASCGLNPKEPIGDESIEAIAEETQGKWVKAKTKHEEYEGKMKEKIHYFISAFEDDAEDDIIQHREKKANGTTTS